ncbi:hypothetical protein J1605_022501 [Eschrichtius robustus]|uniref:Phosphatidylinositol 4-phosphate 5-kinase type-1 beta n=1 Tax=Eschrichtius robustus TaxID=9764 RepID=A0AB34HAX6_ESCRO|nr:hypothetical protein J1605_022501 [Eschrichtius robustus]
MAGPGEAMRRPLRGDVDECPGRGCGAVPGRSHRPETAEASVVGWGLVGGIETTVLDQLDPGMRGWELQRTRVGTGVGLWAQVPQHLPPPPGPREGLSPGSSLWPGSPGWEAHVLPAGMAGVTHTWLAFPVLVVRRPLLPCPCDDHLPSPGALLAVGRAVSPLPSPPPTPVCEATFSPEKDDPGGGECPMGPTLACLAQVDRKCPAQPASCSVALGISLHLSGPQMLAKQISNCHQTVKTFLSARVSPGRPAPGQFPVTPGGRLRGASVSPVVQGATVSGLEAAQASLMTGQPGPGHGKKLGHRGVDASGETTYKKTTSSTLKGAIQLGIGYTVGNLSSKPERDVLMQDFYVVESIFFPSEGSNLTPAHHFQDFRFKTYAPVAFRYFRELFGIRPDDYLVSVSSAAAAVPRPRLQPRLAGSDHPVCCLLVSVGQERGRYSLPRAHPGGTVPSPAMLVLLATSLDSVLSAPVWF